MADETFEIGFVVSGQGDASQAFENLKIAELQAREEAAQLSNELKRLKASGSATSTQIDTTARAMIRAKQSATQLAAEARKVDQAQRAKAASAIADANASRTATAASDAQGRSYGQLANHMRGGMGAITGLTNSLTALGGATLQTNTNMALVNSALSGVMQVVGMATTGLGPLGIAIGGVTAALGFFSTAMQSASRDTDELRESAEKAVQSLDQLLARRRQEESESSRESRIGMGLGSSAEQEAAVERQATVLATLQEQEAALNRQMGSARTRRELQAASSARGRLEEITRSRRAAEAELENLRGLAEQARREEDEIIAVDVMGGEGGIVEGADAGGGGRTSRRRGGRGRAAGAEDPLDAAQETAELASTLEALQRIADLSQELEDTGTILDPLARAAADARAEVEQTLAVSDAVAQERARAQQAQAEETRRLDDQRAAERRARGMEEARAYADELARQASEYEAFIGTLSGLDDESRRYFENGLESRQRAHRTYLLALEEAERAHTAALIAEAGRREAGVAAATAAAQSSATEFTRESVSQRAAIHSEGEQKVSEASERSAMKIKQIQDQMWGGLANTVTAAAGDMFQFIVEGGDLGSDAFLSMLDSFLEATAIEYSIKALAEAANAVAAAARMDPAAAAHATAAGLAAGVAAATGLASAAISVPDTGGSQTPSQAQPAQQNDGGGPASFNVSLFAPQAVFTEAERGQLLAHGFREARRQMGPGAVRY